MSSHPFCPSNCLSVFPYKYLLYEVFLHLLPDPMQKQKICQIVTLNIICKGESWILRLNERIFAMLYDILWTTSCVRGFLWVCLCKTEQETCLWSHLEVELNLSNTKCLLFLIVSIGQESKSSWQDSLGSETLIRLQSKSWPEWQSFKSLMGVGRSASRGLMPMPGRPCVTERNSVLDSGFLSVLTIWQLASMEKWSERQTDRPDRNYSSYDLTLQVTWHYSCHTLL